MGLFKKKTKDPAPVGQAMCLLDNDGWGFVNQQHHQNMDPDVIAMLAPITFVISEAARLRHRGPSHVNQWLTDAQRHATAGADATNRLVNPGGVAPLQNPNGVAEPGVTGAWGSFVITPDSHLTGSWRLLDGYSSDTHRTRILGTLLAAATWRDAESALPHAFEVLAESAIDFDNPAVFTSLPQMALDYGIHQAALSDLMSAPPWEDLPPAGHDVDDPPF